MIGRCVRLTATEQDDVLAIAGQMQAETGTELPSVEHTRLNLERWSRTVREQNAGQAIAMMIHAIDHEQYEELMSRYEKRVHEKEQWEIHQEARDLYDAAVEAGSVHY